MKLIDLMVKENVQWPEGAEFAAQDSDKDLDFYADRPVFYEATWYVGAIARHVMTIGLHAIADDYNLSIVTKHEYEQAQVKAAYDKTVGACATFTVDSEADALDAEIERALGAADADYADETLAVINEHLRELYAMKREWLRGDLDEVGARSGIDIESAPKSIQPVNITDWWKLREGDAISRGGLHYTVTGVDLNKAFPVRVVEEDGKANGLSLRDGDWQFISRPS